MPFDKIVFDTKLSQEEVSNRLNAVIEPRKFFRISLSGKKNKMLYEGEIKGTSFKISRIINYRNSFLPVVFGEIISDGNQTRVIIKMRPSKSVIIFMTLWLGLVGLLCLGILISGILQLKQILKTGFSPASLIPFGMFAFGYSLIFFGYRFEAQKTKDFLIKLFK